MRRKALALGIALALVLASIPVLLVLNSHSKPSGAVEMSLPLPELTVTVNGRTVYAGPDPPTSNMIQMLSAAIGSSLSVSVVDASGRNIAITQTGAVPIFYWNIYGKISHFPMTYYVALGNGSQSFSRSVIKLASQIVRVNAGTNVGYNSTHAWLDIVGSYQFPSKNMITEVGVVADVIGYWTTGGAYGCEGYFPVLMLYTPVPTISVEQGDLVVVRYRFYFTKPFTVQMAKYLSLWIYPSINGVTISTTMNHTSGTSNFLMASTSSCYLVQYSIPYFYKDDVRSKSPQVYLAYGNGNQPWSIWDRYVYSPLGRAPLETVTASDNAVQMVFYINNPGSTDMHITELALQVNTTDASGVWRLVTLARWTVDYTIPAGSGVHIAVRVATP